MNTATCREREGSPEAPVVSTYSVNVEALIERLSGTSIAVDNHDENRNPLVSSEKSYPEKVNTGSSSHPLLKIKFGTEVGIRHSVLP